MPEQRSSQEQTRLLADIAEMYYLEEMNQSEIGKKVNLTRSMVSRLLTEARQNGIVDIRILRPLESDHELEAALTKKFKLYSVYVVVVRTNESANLLNYLGGAGAQLIHRYLSPGVIFGLTWGTSASAVVEQFEADKPMPIKVVQLAGSMGPSIHEYDGHNLITSMAQKLGGEGYFLDAPFFCQTAELAKELRAHQGIRETLELAKKVDVALLGIGSTEPSFSSFYRAGTVPLNEIVSLQEHGAVGAVCGLHFDYQGHEVCADFCERLVGIQRDDLLAIPIRIGVAGGPSKVRSIQGALRGGYVNALITDNQTAQKVLDLK
jgi:deoxyribonucleoside regulator